MTCFHLNAAHVFVSRGLVLAMSAILLLGCGGGANGRQPVTGAVSFNGEPLAGGWIYFRPLGEGPSSAGQIRDGRFKIAAQQGLLPGSYQVAIEYQQPTGRKVKVYTGELIDEEKQIIPPQYNQQTTLTAEIQAEGSNHLTFDLESDD